MTLQIDGTLWLAGAGNMGLALLAGWLAQGLPPGRIVVQEPSPSPDAKALAARQGIALQPTLAAGTPPPSVLVVAVKPQVMDEVFAGLAGRVSPRTLVLSIAAGRTPLPRAPIASCTTLGSRKRKWEMNFRGCAGQA
jgi:pyrroline-5-carboxylate reductase